jgi:thiol:disulfide interchange protein DsbA
MNLRRHLLSLLLLLPASVFALPYAPGPANDASFLPGRDYTVLQVPVPVVSGDKLEVREFFYYGCSHCYALQPAVNAWLKTKPADVTWIHTPAVLNPAWQTLGRAFYVAEELGVLEQTHAQLFTSIHVGGQRFENKEAVGKFFVRMGVAQEKFDAAWDSFSVRTKIRNADALSRKYMIQGTPTITVAGKYVVPSSARTFATVDYLLGVERAARNRK